jgi:hypothetical protein
MAAYMTLAKLKELGDVVVERDTTFGGREEKELTKEKKEAEKRRALRAQETRIWPIESATSNEPAIPIEPAVPLKLEVPVEPEVLSV